MKRIDSQQILDRPAALAAKPTAAGGLRLDAVASLEPLPLKFARILAPVDFSAPSLHAMRAAMGLAAQHGAELVLVHIMEEVFYPGDWWSPAFGSMSMAMEKREEVRQHLESLTRESGVKVGTVVRLGRAWQEITEIAREEKADLIVIATHGYTGLRHALLGSVAEKVLRHAPCPVLCLRAESDPEELGMAG